MRYGGVLTQVRIEPFFAYCAKCQKVYQDNVKMMGSVRCPSCDLAVERGITKEQACKMLDDDQKELLR